MSNKDALQTAIDCGVATYETCVVLDWNKTKLYWCKNYYGSLLVKTLQEVRLLCEKHGENYLIVLCEAPQMHEIAQQLPDSVDDFGLIQHTTAVFYLPLCFPNSEGNYVDVKNHHYAQAYAELYIKLRDVGLLKKEVSNGE